MKRLLAILFLGAIALKAATPVLSVHTNTTTTLGGTSSGINTASPVVNFLVAFEWCNSSGTTTTPVDSQSNTWTSTTEFTNGGKIRFWYVLNPTTNASHTFTAPSLCVLLVAGFTGAGGGTDGSPVGATQSATPQKLTAITPSVVNDLFLAAGFEPTGSADAAFAPCNNEAASTACTNPHFSYAQIERVQPSGELLILYYGVDSSTNALTTVFSLANSFTGVIEHMAFKPDSTAGKFPPVILGALR